MRGGRGGLKRFPCEDLIKGCRWNQEKTLKRLLQHRFRSKTWEDKCCLKQIWSSIDSHTAGEMESVIIMCSDFITYSACPYLQGGAGTVQPRISLHCRLSWITYFVKGPRYWNLTKDPWGSPDSDLGTICVHTVHLDIDYNKPYITFAPVWWQHKPPDLRASAEKTGLPLYRNHRLWHACGADRAEAEVAFSEWTLSPAWHAHIAIMMFKLLNMPQVKLLKRLGLRYHFSHSFCRCVYIYLVLLIM